MNTHSKHSEYKNTEELQKKQSDKFVVMGNRRRFIRGANMKFKDTFPLPRGFSRIMG